MNNIFKLIILFPILIVGCTPNLIEENKIKQKIDNLDMIIYSEKGDKIYSIISPNSTYDKIQLNFNLKKTTVNIFEGEDIRYVINSDSSKLTNNNEIVELNGNVQLRSLNKNEILNGDYLIWNINKTKYELTGNVRFENNNIILKSPKANLGKDNIIEFFNPVQYLIKGKNNDKKYEINSENAYYNIKTESISFSSKDKRVRSVIYF